MPSIKAIPPAHLAQYRATRKDKKNMSASAKTQCACSRCKTLYRAEMYSSRCESYHAERRAKQQRLYDQLKKDANEGNKAALRLVQKWKWEE